MDNGKTLRENLRKVHTTPMGEERIKKNLRLDVSDVEDFCRTLILNENCVFCRRGKNWYCTCCGCELTVNASSYTVITAKTVKKI